MSAEQTIVVLRVLNGSHAGAEMRLGDGHFVIGRDDHDDVVLQDSSVAPRHAVLSLSESGVEIIAKDGSVATSTTILAPGQQQMLLQPAMVGIGQLRIGIGAPDADWGALSPVMDASASTVSDRATASAQPPSGAATMSADSAASTSRSGGRATISALALRRWAQQRPVASLGLALLALLAIIGLIWALWPNPPPPSPQQQAQAQLTKARQLAAASACPQVAVHEVDGSLQLTGYCESLEKLQQLITQLSKAGLEASNQVHLLDTMRRQVSETLSRLGASDLTFKLSASGVLTVSGFYDGNLALPELSSTLRTDVAGLSTVDLKVRTLAAARQQLQQLIAKSNLNGLLDVKAENGALVVDSLNQAKVTQAEWQALAAKFTKLSDGEPPLQVGFAFAKPVESPPATVDSGQQSNDSQASLPPLTGIVVIDGGDSFAVFKGIGEVRVGEDVVHGYAVTQIHPQSVVVSSPAGKRTLRLRE